jgi:hypothetical protein
LDANFSPILRKDEADTFVDKRGRPVSVSGYLIDGEGNIVNQEGNKVFNKEDLRGGVDLPVPVGLERFNFNPLDILGNIDELALLQLKPDKKGKYYDKNGRQISKFGFLINKAGDIVDRKGRKVLRKQYLKTLGEFPQLLNY